jgi:DNA-binding GntR family transcriptional regulator
LNRDFHSELYQASGLQYHLDIIDNAMDRVDRYLRTQLVLSNGMKRAHEEHMAIWNACNDGNAAQAAELTRRHILDARDMLMENIASLR